MNGYFQLGEALFGGGVDREGAYLEGLNTGSQINHRRAQTQNALAQARQRQQEAEASEQIGDALEAAGLSRDIAPVIQAGRGADFKSTVGGLEGIQGMDFRNVLADPSAGAAARQGAGLALRGAPIVAGDVLGPGGELAVPGLFEGAFDPRVTPTGEAQIGADQALAADRLASAALDDAKRQDPAAFRSSGPTVNVNTPLSEAILPGGQGTSIVPEGINAEEAFGAEAVLKNGINSLVDFFGGGTPYVDNAVAQNTLNELSARTQIAMRADVPGGRPPVMVQELLARYAEDPAQLFRGDELARINLRTTHDSLVRSRDRIRDMLNSPTKKTPTRQGELEEAYLNLSDTIADYGAILNSLEAQYGPVEGAGDGWQTTQNGTRYRVVQ